MSKRLSREEKRSVTRGQLLEAAQKVFARRGYYAASVDEIAEEAGYSKGALYSNFESKEDLFLSLIVQRMDEKLSAINEAFRQGETLQERLLAGGRFVNSIVAEDPQWCLLYMEFWAYAMRDTELRKKVAAQYMKWRTEVAELVDAQAHEFGLAMPAASEQIATVVIALFDGYVLQKLVDPDSFADDGYGALITLFFGGLAALGGTDMGALRPGPLPTSSG